MAISSSTRKAGPFVGNDATTVFPFAFKVFAAADLLVVRTSALGVESDLVLDADYTVILNSNQDSDPGGSVTLPAALVTGTRLTITSDVEALQPLVLTNNGGFYPRVINDAFDKITIIAQQLVEQVGRSLKLPISSTASPVLPDPVPNSILAWNSAANGFVNVAPGDLATVSGYADARVETFNGDGTETEFEIDFNPGVLANLDISISGVTQVAGVDFTWIGTAITFAAAPPNGTVIQVRYARPLSPPPALDAAVAAAAASAAQALASENTTVAAEATATADAASALASKNAAEAAVLEALAAQVAAETAQGLSENARDLSQQYASDAAGASGVNVPSYASRASLAGATVAAAIKQIATRGYATEGDGGGANYVRTSFATITSAGYPAASYQRSVDRIMPDGSTDAVNGGYWLINERVFAPEMFYEVADAADWAPAWTRAAAAAAPERRSLAATPNKTYDLLSGIEIWPEADGWTPPIIGNDCVFRIGGASPTISHEVAGFRYRGIKSGAVANAIQPRMRDCTFDANNIEFSNGVRSIWMENASEWEFLRVRGKNYKQGYHISNWRYADGGAVTGKAGRVFQCDCSGFVLASAAGKTWYPYSEAGDLSGVVPGDSIPAGATTFIGVTQTGNSGNGTPRLAVSTLFENGTASPITVPADLTTAALTGAGLTDLGTTGVNGGVTVGAEVFAYCTSGGQTLATTVHFGAANVVEDCVFIGARYAAYTQVSDGATFRNIVSQDSIRGIAFEWSAINGVVEDCLVKDSLSSGVLFGYGCFGWRVDRTGVECLSSRWVGEALFNFQLSSGKGRGKDNWTKTRTTVNDGQYHVHVAVNSGDVFFHGNFQGDCNKAYVCIESAWNQTLAGTIPELYSAGAGLQGAASEDMARVVISGSILPESTKATNNGATLVAILQIDDVVNGDVGLSYVDVSNLRAGYNKIPVRYYKIYEGATAAKQVNNCALQDVEFPAETVPSTAASRMILPRKWAHFRLVSNASNLDDNVERVVPNVATPDLTFGRFWFDTGSTALSGVLGGQGASSSEGYEGREIIVRGNNSRAWTTTSGVSGTRDGLRVTGSPVTPTNVQRLRLTFNRTQFSWIGGIV